MTLDKYISDFSGSFDVGLQVLCNQISDHYIAFLRAKILPHIPKSLGLNVREVRVLMSIYFYKAGATPKQIAQILSNDPATITRAVARLKESGLITQEDNIEDTRSAWLTLTDTGREIVQMCATIVESHVEDYERGSDYIITDEDKEDLLKIFMRMRARSHAIAKHKS